MTDKFKALVHYIIYQCRDNPAQLGAIRLNKTLWYADVEAFQYCDPTKRKSITGCKYVKREFGPVPKSIRDALRELQDEEKILIKDPTQDHAPRLFISIAEPDPSALSDGEKSITNGVLKFVCGQTARAISASTHDLIWEAADMDEEIPLAATLAVEMDDPEVPGAHEWAVAQAKKLHTVH